MRKLILTTKKTNMAYMAGQLLGDVLFAAIGVFLLQKVDALRARWQFSQAQTIESLAVLCLIFAFLSLVYHLMVSGTYADVYSDRIAGKAMQKIAIKSFNLRFDQITDISCSKGILNVESGSGVFLVINTSAGNYKIVTTASRAKEIIDFYSEAVEERQRQNDQF